MLYIRPHHINCLFFYKGIGYNQEFTENMNQIHHILHRNIYTQIKLVSHCDSICSCCPNKSPLETCSSYEKIELLDADTLKYYGLHDNKNYNFKDIISEIYKNYDLTKFFMICSKCEWFKKDVCSEELIAERKKFWINLNPDI